MFSSPFANHASSSTSDLLYTQNMSNLYFILIAIFFPVLSVLSFILSLLAHIQTERTRKLNTRALRRLRVDVNNLAKMDNEKLTENEHAENNEQATAPTVITDSANAHILSYSQETSLLVHLAEILRARYPHFTGHRIDTIVNEFGNGIRERRGSENDSLEEGEEYLSHQLLRTLLNAELDLTSGQMGAILDDVRMKLRELCVGEEEVGSEGHWALNGEHELVESVEGAGLTQSWSGDTLVGRDEDDNIPILT